MASECNGAWARGARACMRAGQRRRGSDGVREREREGAKARGRARAMARGREGTRASEGKVARASEDEGALARGREKGRKARGNKGTNARGLGGDSGPHPAPGGWRPPAVAARCTATHLIASHLVAGNGASAVNNRNVTSDGKKRNVTSVGKKRNVASKRGFNSEIELHHRWDAQFSVSGNGASAVKKRNVTSDGKKRNVASKNETSSKRGFNSEFQLHHRWDVQFSVYVYTYKHTITGLHSFELAGFWRANAATACGRRLPAGNMPATWRPARRPPATFSNRALH